MSPSHYKMDFETSHASVKSDLWGILHPPRAFTGPNTVQIDLTNNCNNDCIACWCHSPLLEERRMAGAKKRRELAWDVIRTTIDDLAGLGTQEIVLAGSGEPFMHSHIWDILELIAHHEMRCNLITNSTLLDATGIEKLVQLGVHTLTVSLWAGSPEAYAATHPNKTENDFGRIAQILAHLNQYKSANLSPFPVLKIIDVIMRQNAEDIERMVDFGLIIHADHIEFNLVDIIPGKTDSLSLRPPECAHIRDTIARLRARRDYVRAFSSTEPRFHEIVAFYNEMEHRDRFVRVPSGFQINLASFEITCPQGQTTGMHYPDPHRHGFIYQFNRERCQACPTRRCGLDRTTWTRFVPTLSLSNCNTLLRRTAEASTHADRTPTYDSSILSWVPCYVGWIYSRILVNGDVVPCCKGYRMALGNVYERRFNDIWYSSGYDHFRGKALSSVKSDPFFASIECYKGCDNLEMILDVHRRLVELHENNYGIIFPRKKRKEVTCR